MRRSSRGLSGLLLLLSASTGAPASAQSLYLHSPSEQEATATLATSLEAARTAHLAALDHHDADLKAAMQREEADVVRSVLTRRDAVLSRVIGGDVAPLDAVLTVRLTSLNGGVTPGAGQPLPALRGDPAAEARFLSDIRQAREIRLELDRRQGALDRASALAKLRNEPAAACDAKIAPAVGEVPTGAPAIFCLQVRQRYQALIRSVPCSVDEVSRTLLAVAARVRACWDGASAHPLTFAGEIGDAIGAVEMLGDAVAKQRQAAALVSGELKTLESYIACEQNRAGQPDATARIAAAAGQIDVILKVVGGIKDGKVDAAATPDTPPLPACPSQAGSVQPSSLPSLLAMLRAVLQTANRFDATRSIGAAAAEAAQAFRADKLGEILQAAATPATPPEGRTGTIVAALIRSAGPLERLAQIHAGTLPDTSGALVALAEARMRATTAAIEAERLQRLRALAEQKVTALTAEALLVRQSLAALHGATPNPDRAVVLYATSVERGRIPAEVVTRRLDNIEFEMWSRRERAAVEAGYAALAPATAELKAYGEGGIRADTIARFLNVAGLAAIAGTN